MCQNDAHRSPRLMKKLGKEYTSVILSLNEEYFAMFFMICSKVDLQCRNVRKWRFRICHASSIHTCVGGKKVKNLDRKVEGYIDGSFASPKF